MTSGGGLVGSARVEITGDLAAFAERTQADLEGMFARWDEAFTAQFEAVTASFGGAGAEAGTSFARGVSEPIVAGSEAAVSEAAAAVGESAPAEWGAIGAAAGGAMVTETAAAITTGTAETDAAAARAGATAGEAMATGTAEGVLAGTGRVTGAAVASVDEAGVAAGTRFGELGTVAGEKFGEHAKEGILAGKEALLVGIGALGFAEVVKSSLEAGDQLEGANLKVEHVFGESSGAVEAWARSLQGSFGLSQAGAESLAGSFAQMLRPLGLGQAETAGMSEKLTTLTQDVAKFNNADPAAVQQAIIAGLRGRATALRQYGIDLSQTSILEEAQREGLVKKGQALTDTAKTQAAYNLIMAQTKNQQGAVGDSASTLAQRQKILGAEWTNMTADLGLKLFPIMSSVEGFLIHDFVPAIEDVGHVIAENRAWLVPLVTVLGAAFLAYKLTGLAAAAYGGITRGVSAVLGFFSGSSTAAAAATTRLAEAETAAMQAALDQAAAQAAVDEAVGAGAAESAAAAAATANLARASTTAAAADTELAAAQAEVDATSRGSMMSMGGLVGTMAAVAVGGYFLGKGLASAVESGNLMASTLTNLSSIEKGFTNALVESNGALTANVRASLQSQLESSGLADRAAHAGTSYQQLIAGITGSDAALAQLAAHMRAHGASDDTLIALKLQHDAYQQSKTDAATLSGSNSRVAASETGVASAARATAAAQKAQAASVTQLAAANEALINTLLAEAQSQDGFLEAERSATSAIKTNGTSLSENSAKGLANRDALLTAVQAALSLKDAQDKAGGSTTAHTRTLAANITSLRNAAIAAGADKGQVDRLLGSLHAMPSQIRTAIHVDSATAAYNIAFIKQQIADLPTYKSITIGVNQVNTGQGSSTYNSQVPGHNAGGTDDWRGGLTWVGEDGPELLNLPRGSQITPAGESTRVAASLGGGDAGGGGMGAGSDRETLAMLAQISKKLDALGMLGHLPALPGAIADNLNRASRGAALDGRTSPAGRMYT